MIVSPLIRNLVVSFNLFHLDVILSLVRTRAVGHLRDIRRLVVAVSRSRLGLYIFGRMKVFDECPELSPTFHYFKQRPTKLALNLEEKTFGGCGRDSNETGAMTLINDVYDMWDIVQKTALHCMKT